MSQSNKDIDFELEFDRIFKQNYHKVVFYAYNYIQDMEKAKNIAQDTFYQLWKHKEDINYIESPLPWLLIIAKRLSLNILRKEQHKGIYTASQKKNYELIELNTEALTDISSTLLYTHEVQKLFTKGLEMMPPTVKETFLLSRSHDLKYREIAEKLNISQKTVEKRISVALSILRRIFKDYLPLFIGYCLIRVLN